MLELLVLLTTASAIEVLDSGGAITIDGHLDETAWSLGQSVPPLVRYQPTPGDPPQGSTDVRFLQDEQHLYIGVTVSDTGYRPRARVSPRESIDDDDQIGIYIDTMGDARSGYIFYFNPLGIQQDIRTANGEWFFRWNTVMYSEGHVSDDGYTLEIAIPFRSLRYPGADENPQTWGVIVTRKIPEYGEKYSYPPIQRNHPQKLALAAPLTGVVPQSQGSGLSIQPAVVLKHLLARDDNDDEFTWNPDDTDTAPFRPSLDLRFGITPKLSTALTINPDFSQIEGDVLEIDLNQRFAFFYPEQRPFFLDGIDTFTDPPEILYTRSVVAPLYGIKISGDGPLGSVGILHTLDAQPNASIHEQSTPGFSDEDIIGQIGETTFARFRMNAFDSGALGLTIADRRLLHAPGFLSSDEPTNSGAFNDVISADARIPLPKDWIIQGNSSLSAAGDTANTLVGHQGGVLIQRRSDFGWKIETDIQDTTTDYRREMGFLTQSGLTTVESEIGYGFGFQRHAWVPFFLVESARERNGDGDIAVGHSQRAVISGRHRLEMVMLAQRFTQDDVELNGWEGELSWRGRLSRMFSLELSGLRGRQLDYDTLTPATSTTIIAEGTLRPTIATRLEFDVVQQWFEPDNQESQSATRIFSRFNWQFTKPLGARIIQQTTLSGSDSPSSTEASTMVTWMQNPGREGYLGATWRLEDSTITEQLLFTKITWVFAM